MAKYTLWFIANHSLDKPQLGNWHIFPNTKLKYNTHIELSYKIVARRLRTSPFYQ
jgi:hypothetical protein